MTSGIHVSQSFWETSFMPTEHSHYVFPLEKRKKFDISEMKQNKSSCREPTKDSYEFTDNLQQQKNKKKTRLDC